ncbi:MAG: hypothetical protein K6C36_07780 [Clostridia bacterium]|nr:hypothetical protein [Clostridia bacterium]
MDHDKLRKLTNRGWNTWYTPSMTSHVLLPYGFCIGLCFKSRSEPKVIRFLKVGDRDLRPAERSWDGAYTRLSFSAGSTKITVESAEKDGEQFLLVTPGEGEGPAPALVIEASLLWGRPGSVFLKDGRLGAEFADGKRVDIYTTGRKDGFVHALGSCPCVSVTLDGPVAVATVPVTVGHARGVMDSARAAVLGQEAGYGADAEVYRAMRSCLAWNTVYDPEHDRICTPVNRNWSEGNGGYVLFEWDTFFAALMCGMDNRELALLNAFAITDEMTDDGFVPNFAVSNGGKSRDRSQPPVGAMTVLRLWERFREDWFVKEMFAPLYRWNTWFHERRRLPGGAMCWGSDDYISQSGMKNETTDVGNLQGAKYESGLDNSPMYDGAVLTPRRAICFWRTWV